MTTKPNPNGVDYATVSAPPGLKPVRLRWKKNPYPTGLARVGSGHPGHTLRAGDTTYANAYEHGSRRQKGGWFWVARFDPIVPLKNTCSEPPVTEAEAKAGAMAYVKECLAKVGDEANLDPNTTKHE